MNTTKIIKYKLTDKNGNTKNNTHWEVGTTHEATGDLSQGLCSDAYIHVYDDPLIAVIMNSRHAHIIEPILWRCEVSGDSLVESLKSGYRVVTMLERVELPVLSNEQLIAFAILCSLKVYRAKHYVKWAEDWLSGKDRSRGSAVAAYTGAAATYATACVAVAADAADDADAAYADAADAVAADAADAGAAYVAYAAVAAAAYAAYAADAVAGIKIDFIALAKQAMTY